MEVTELKNDGVPLKLLGSLEIFDFVFPKIIPY